MTKQTKYNEIRTRHNQLDDIVISDCTVHIEQMHPKLWWIGVYKGKRKKRATFLLQSERNILMILQEDALKLPIIEQEEV